MNDSPSRTAPWRLDPSVTFLNHGSFGACPIAVLDAQARIRDEIEREPVTFFGRELEDRLDAARLALARFVGADADGLAFVDNATTGANAVIRSLRFEPGEEILATSHGYNAVRNAIDFAAERSGARMVVADVPFPISGPGEIRDRVLAAVTPRTRLAVVDHVTSPTALVFPVGSIVADLADRGVDTLVDGAHAPGMVDLDVDAVGAAYYAGNCHKWLCAPKGAGFLHVRRDRRDRVHPTTISHGRNAPREDRSRFRLEFDWTGTRDPSPYLCVPDAIRAIGEMHPGGWAGVRARNRALALEASEILAARIPAPAPGPPEMIGAMASTRLPPVPAPPSPRRLLDPVQEALFERYRIEVPVFPFPDAAHRVIRVSAQLYNERGDYERLCDALSRLLGGTE